MLEMCSNWSYQVVTLERHDVVYHPHYGFLQTGQVQDKYHDANEAQESDP